MENEGSLQSTTECGSSKDNRTCPSLAYQDTATSIMSETLLYNNGTNVNIEKQQNDNSDAASSSNPNTMEDDAELHENNPVNEFTVKLEFPLDGSVTSYSIRSGSTQDEVIDEECEAHEEQLNSYNEFEEMLTSASGEKPYTCDQCEKSYTHHQSLARHRRIHKQTKNNEAATLINYLNDNLPAAGVESAIQASCLNVPEKINSVMHKRKNHVCPQCGRSFNQYGSLTAHIRIHTGHKPYTCDQCNRAFTLQRNMMRHRLVHNIEKTHICHICDKTFTHLQNLKIHRRIHTGERPYVCEYCNKSFIQIQHLTIHRKIHVADKSFVCFQCGRAFMEMQALDLHQRMHTGERPFVCDKCNKSFTQLSYLTAHKRTHVDEKPFVCDNCSKSFSQIASLKRHVRIHGRNKL